MADLDFNAMVQQAYDAQVLAEANSPARLLAHLPWASEAWAESEETLARWQQAFARLFQATANELPLAMSEFDGMRQKAYRALAMRRDLLVLAAREAELRTPGPFVVVR